jgi:DNA-binding transcriptional MerR regulator
MILEAEMKFIITTAIISAFLISAAASSALTVDEITRLKEAGVSDAVIQKMLEQEAAGVKNEGPMVDDGSEVTFSAGKSVKAESQRKKQHERWKEKKAMDALQGVIIDQRTNQGSTKP